MKFNTNEPVRGTTMCAELVDGVMLVVHGTMEPAAEEWSAYCEYAGAIRRSAGGRLRTLVLTASDAGPNAGQRAEYQRRVAGANNRVAVLCAGGVTRAILTAMSWFNPDMKAFGVGEIDRGIDYLEAFKTPNLMRAIESMRAHLSASRSAKTG